MQQQVGNQHGSTLIIPQHLAIIMDGNNRWAKQNTIPIAIAYRKGAQAAENIIKICKNYGVKWLTLYAFSTENWERDHDEVSLLMSIFKEYMLNYLSGITDEQMRIIFIGERNRIPRNIVKIMEDIENKSKQHDTFTLVLAVSYGSRNEILNAAFAAASDIYKNDNSLSKELYNTKFSQHINPHGIPDPDLLIRTSGEKRLSNFLLWQLAYTELYFTNVLWPDFNERVLNDAFIAFSARHRRYGRR